MTDQLLSHVAMTVPRSIFTPDYVEQLATFYESILGWQVSSTLSIDDERFVIFIPGNGQYLNVRASDQPMATSGYEHLGIYVKTEKEVRNLFERVKAESASREEVELDEEMKVAYDGKLTVFRFRYLMPLAIEIQHIQA